MNDNVQTECMVLTDLDCGQAEAYHATADSSQIERPFFTVEVTVEN